MEVTTRRGKPVKKKSKGRGWLCAMYNRPSSQGKSEERD